MKEFTQPEIEATRSSFKEKGYPVENDIVGNLDVSYFVFPQALSPNLPDFAFRMTGTDQETGEIRGIFGVSDSVPKELRPYWAAHEIIEFTRIGINEDDRCVQAEETVVKLIPSPLRREYIDRRIAFFTNLITYFREDVEAESGNFTQDDIVEAKTSLKYLQLQLF